MHGMTNDLHILINRSGTQAPHKSATSFRYLPISAEHRAWGAYMPTAGFAFIPPSSPYPPRQHPADHHFTWETGRILHAFQFLYITRGGGTFESAQSGVQEIKAGDLFILYPDVWHRYRPAFKTGWDEHWIEFDGEYARQLMQRREFAPERAVLHLGLHAPLLQPFHEAIDLLRRQPANYQFILGALVGQLIAQTISAIGEKHYEGRPVSELIREAKEVLARRGSTPVDLRKLAGQLRMSYSSFRRLFKAHTGFSPRQFALEVSIQRAGDLLKHTARPVYAIVHEVGFDSIHYFSRVFKQKTGHSPIAVRKAAFEARQQGRGQSLLEKT
jgi:AraC-like DNA-binding protein